MTVLNRDSKELAKREKELLIGIAKERKDNAIEFLYAPKHMGGITPNPKQHAILEAFKNPFYKTIVMSGGNRSGKTTVWVWIALSMLAGKWLWNGEPIEFPHDEPRKIRIVGQSWEDHIKKVVIPEIKKWWPKNRKVKTSKNNVGAEHLWEDLATGSTIELMSNKQESDVFEGWPGDAIFYDEPPKREIYIANSRGLVDRLGRNGFFMTLLKEPWVNREVINRRNKDGSPDMSVFAVHAESWDNVGYGITKEGLDQFMKDLTPDEIKARIKGIPSYMSGLICEDFKRQVHLKKRFPIPTDWLVDIAIDVHPKEPQAILFLATNPFNLKYGCFEIFENGNGTQTADKIVRLVKRYGLRVNRVIIDPLAKGDKNSDETVFDKIRVVLERHDMILETASKDKVSGILEINEGLMGPNEEPSLFFFEDMNRTVFEIEGWMIDEKTQLPAKKDDHFMENLYRLMLLNTVWYPADEWEEDTRDYGEGDIDDQTGY